MESPSLANKLVRPFWRWSDIKVLCKNVEQYCTNPNTKSRLARWNSITKEVNKVSVFQFSRKQVIKKWADLKYCTFKRKRKNCRPQTRQIKQEVKRVLTILSAYEEKNACCAGNSSKNNSGTIVTLEQVNVHSITESNEFQWPNKLSVKIQSEQNSENLSFHRELLVIEREKLSLLRKKLSIKEEMLNVHKGIRNNTKNISEIFKAGS